MARSRDDYEDDFDDRPRRRGRDNEYDDDEEERPKAKGSARRGRDKLATPGTFLAIASGIGLTLLVLGFLANITGLDGNRDKLDQMIADAKAAPPGPGRDAQVKVFQKYRRNFTALVIGSSLLFIAIHITTLIAGQKMQSAEGFGLALTGSLRALLPCGGCCILTLPAGIWCLIILFDPDVKAAFAKSARRRR